MPDPAVLESIIRHLYDAWSRGDSSYVGTVAAPEFVARYGPDTMAQHATTRAAFPDFRWSIDAITVDGSRVFCLTTAKGTNTGDVPGQPATGREVTARSAAMWEFDDAGHIISSSLHDDRDGLGARLQDDDAEVEGFAESYTTFQEGTGFSRPDTLRATSPYLRPG